MSTDPITRMQAAMERITFSSHDEGVRRQNMVQLHGLAHEWLTRRGQSTTAPAAPRPLLTVVDDIIAAQRAVLDGPGNGTQALLNRTALARLVRELEARCASELA